MSASQPQAVAVLRDKLEALYQADVASNSQEMSKIQKEGADLWTALMKDKEAQLPRVEEAAACEKPESTWSLEEKHLEPDSSQSLTISDSGSKLEASNFKVRREVIYQKVTRIRDQALFWGLAHEWRSCEVASKANKMYIHLLWFNFILGSIFIFVCFILIFIDYHTQKQREIKIEPRIKLNHNISALVASSR